MHEVLVNRLGGLSLPRKSVVRLTNRPDMTLDVYRGRIKQQLYNNTTVTLSFNEHQTENAVLYIQIDLYEHIVWSGV